MPFEEWTEVLNSECLTGALLDRITHYAQILETNGDSYRLEQSHRKPYQHFNGRFTEMDTRESASRPQSCSRKNHKVQHRSTRKGSKRLILLML